MTRTRGKRVAFEPHYSGGLSRKFWNAINKLERAKDEGRVGGLYAAAVLLQNAEGSLLTWLNNDLNFLPPPSRKGKRGKK